MIKRLRDFIIDIINIKKIKEEAQKEREAAEENNKIKSKVLARISHEIRTPISAILGISEIQLQDASLPIQAEEAFAKIYNSAGALLSIVNDMLDLYELELGKMDILKTEYDTASLINDVVQLNVVYISSKKLDFMVNIDENVPAKLIGDGLRVKQILNYFLANAIKFTSEGFVEFSVQPIVHSEGDLINLKIIIRDTGQGMAAEQIEALKTNAKNAAKEKSPTEDSFILSIALKLAELMDTDIDVASQLGKGTTVVINMPQKTVDTEVLGAEVVTKLGDLKSNMFARKLSFTPESMPYGKVLVVDDVDTNLYVAKGLLSLYELNIETCDHGQKAIDRVKNGEVFDIIFMDYMMPDLDGIEVTKILREMDYTQPIVALTANALIGRSEEFLKNGFDGLISKPIHTGHMNTLLNKFIRDKHKPPTEPKPAFFMPPPRKKEERKTEDEFFTSPEMVEKIQKDFINTQQNILEEINDNMSKGDMKTAHRLAHTLKGYAGLMGEKSLITASETVEKTLKRGEIPTQDLMDKLEHELKAVFVKIM